MRIFQNIKGPIQVGLRLYDGTKNTLSALKSYGLYDGRNLEPYRRRHGEIPVVLIVPRMSDREGALIHPGLQILQTILRTRGVGCEVLNYGLPVSNPRDPFEHLIAVIRTLRVKVLGVTLYSQAIEATMEGLQRIKAACPDLTIVLGGPHPTEAYLSLVGPRFIDFVVRGEAERTFPLLVEAVLKGEASSGVDIPGVYWYDRANEQVHGSPADFVDLEELDRAGALRYQLSAVERKQYRLYGGSHGLVGPRYWPLALVRGCPYACTYCAAHELSGKQLRFRRPETVVDDIEYYIRRYGQRHFSFVDDAFTEHYDYVVDFCEEILRRGLKVFWTTDNGIRYESLGSGRRVNQFLATGRVASVDELLRLMIRAGWRGTAIGLESGAPRVRDELVRKGGTRISNDGILENLRLLKRIAREEGVYFYIVAYIMLGFPDLVLRNGQVIAAESSDEREATYALVMRLRDENVLDFAQPSVLIPLPATEQWDHLSIREKMQILTNRIPDEHPYRAEVDRIIEAVVAETEAETEELPLLPVGGGGSTAVATLASALGTRYSADAEARFWQRVYALPDAAQLLIHGAYDNFNTDSSFKINMRRPAGSELWNMRQRILEDFYGGVRMEWKLMKHVSTMCTNVWEFIGYLATLSRIYMPETKERYNSPNKQPGAPAWTDDRVGAVR
jgi:radical SAM superfamily enzyme YgiQ (UPF0313 family)